MWWEKDSKKSFIDFFAEAAQEYQKGPLVSYFLAGEFDASALDQKVLQQLHEKSNMQLQASIKIIDDRLDPRKTRGYEITFRSQDQSIEIESPTPKEDPMLARLIENPGKLQFYGVHYDGDKELVNRINEHLKKEKGEQGRYVIVQRNSGRDSFFCKVKDADTVKKGSEEVLGQDELLLLGEKSKIYQGQGDDNYYYEVFIAHPNKQYNKPSGFKVEKASSERAKDGKRGYQISVTLDKESTKPFGELTKSLLDMGRTEVRLAIVLDDRVIMAPSVKEKLPSSFVITGGRDGFEQSKANETVIQLRSGALPGKLYVTESNAIGAILGKKQQQKGFFAIFLGFLLILLFMMLYYSSAGIVANVVLIFNLLFILGALAQFGTALTLAGIAGVALTIGMAVDISVVISEKVRQNLTQGMTQRQAIEDAFTTSYKAIIDSNVTTLLAGIILYWFGIGAVKGFAFTLIIGIISSLLTGLVLFRLIFDGIHALHCTSYISFSFNYSKNLFTNLKIAFMKNRKAAYLFSIVFISVGVLINFYQGIEYSTEFSGGKEYVYRFGGNVTKEELEEVITDYFDDVIEREEDKQIKKGTTIVRQYGKGMSFKVTTNFALEQTNIDVAKEIQDAITTRLGKRFLSAANDDVQRLGEDAFTIDSSVEIGSVVASAVQKGSFWAVLLSLLVMLLYIFFSCRNMPLALGAIIALMHDGLMLFACLGYAKLLFGIHYPIGLTFIVSLLTIFGYSINDTMMIIAVLVRMMKRENATDIGKMADVAIQTTLSRTMMTTFTTFLPVSILYFFGGLAVEELAFSLLCGIIWGTYSSVCIAVPISYDIQRFVVRGSDVQVIEV